MKNGVEIVSSTRMHGYCRWLFYSKESITFIQNSNRVRRLVDGNSRFMTMHRVSHLFARLQCILWVYQSSRNKDTPFQNSRTVVSLVYGGLFISKKLSIRTKTNLWKTSKFIGIYLQNLPSDPPLLYKSSVCVQIRFDNAQNSFRR